MHSKHAHQQHQQEPVPLIKSNLPDNQSPNLPSLDIRNQGISQSYSNPMIVQQLSMGLHFSPKRESPPPPHLPLRVSSFLKDEPGVVHKYQLLLGKLFVNKDKKGFDPLKIAQSSRNDKAAIIPKRSAARELLSRLSPADLLRMHLVGNLIPKFLPPLIIGYLFWDISKISEIYRTMSDCRDMLSSVISEADPSTIENLRNIGGSGSRSLDGDRITRALIEVTERYRDEMPSDEESVLTVPESRDPEKIGTWMSGLILAVAITTFKLVIRKCSET